MRVAVLNAASPSFIVARIPEVGRWIGRRRYDPESSPLTPGRLIFALRAAQPDEGCPGDDKVAEVQSGLGVNTL